MKAAPKKKKSSQAGYTLVEVLIAMAVLVIVSQGFLVFMRSATKADRGLPPKSRSQ